MDSFNTQRFWNLICFKHIILIFKQGKELIQMDINKKMRNGIFTMNGEHTQSEN